MSGIRFGKYLLVERLGVGGMGEVWKAVLAGPNDFTRTVALKRILPSLIEEADFAAMFLAEARLLARLTHANIVQVYELGELDGQLYLTMEYVPGRDVARLLRGALELGAAPPAGAGALILRDVCRALAYLHALRDDDGAPLHLVHRDVGPSNVVVGVDGSVKLLDFGIAKALAETSERTRSGALKGKFGYMAPEQVEGSGVDQRVDQFAAGVMLHELLTGQRLFRGDSDLATLALVRRAEVQPPSLRNPAVPPSLDAICLRALARARDDRFPDCAAMARALDDVVHELRWGPELLGQRVRELMTSEPPPRIKVPTQTLAPLSPEASPRAQPSPGAQASREAQAASGAQASPAPAIATRARPARALIVAAAIVVALAGAAWLARPLASRSHPPDPHAPPAIVPVDKPPALALTPSLDLSPLPATAHALVHLKIGSDPAGAEIFVDDEPAARARTPATLELPPVTRTRKLTLRAAGRRPSSTEVAGGEDATVVLSLPPLPSHKSPSKRNAAPDRSYLPSF